MTDEERQSIIIKAAEESSHLRRTSAEALAPIVIDMAHQISGVIGTNGKMLICGNGGSAADGSHMAGEMIVRLTSRRDRQSLPAICLNTDTAVMTATANDYGYDRIFSRQIEGLGKASDVLFVISTSGNSKNLVVATQKARDMNLLVFGLLGGDGGELANLCDKKLIIPHTSVQRIQEEHIFYIHLLVELIESDLCG